MCSSVVTVLRGKMGGQDGDVNCSVGLVSIALVESSHVFVQPGVGKSFFCRLLASIHTRPPCISTVESFQSLFLNHSVVS